MPSDPSNPSNDRPRVAVYQQIANVIEKSIDDGQYTPGQRLYSIRQLCKEFQVGEVTAKRALHILTDRGVVRTVAGSGAYVVGPRRNPSVKQGVGLITLGRPLSAVYQYEIDLIQGELQTLGHPLIYSSTTDLNELSAALEHQVDAGVGCLVLFPRHGSHQDTFDLDAIETTRSRHLPLLILESTSATDPYVMSDTAGATQLLVNHLVTLGHRRICLASIFNRMVDGFHQAMREHTEAGIQPIHLQADTEQGLRKLRNYAREVMNLKPMPTAVIAGNDTIAEVMVDFWLEAGLRVPEDISIATIDDLADVSTVPLTAVRHPWQAISQEVAKWAHAHLSGRGQSGTRFRRSLIGSLIVRDSTGPCPTTDSNIDPD